MEVFQLTIRMNPAGQESILHPVVIKTGNNLFLVDTGYEGSLPLIDEALKDLGLRLEALTGVILTHEDIDHVGGLSELKSALPAIRVYASAIEAPFISGAAKSPRLIQAEELFDQLPESHKDWALAFQERLKAIRRVAVDHQLMADTPWMEGIEVIHTPGHTPGHISLYFPVLKTLVAGDAVVIENGQLNIANPQFTLDLPQAVASVGKLAPLEIDRLICYHGGEMLDEVSEKLQRLFNGSLQS